MSDTCRILLVGASGRVGRMVAHHWSASPPSGLEVIEQHRDPNRKDGLFWSLSEPDEDVLAGHRIDTIVCLAGVTPASGSDLSLNTSLAEAVLSAAHRAGVGRVILASSSAVYGAGNGVPFSESDTTAPVNAYGKAKVAMEEACAAWRKQGIEICCLRIGNVAGADALLLNAARAPIDEPLMIDCFTDGRGPIRSYIGAGTLANVLSNLSSYAEPLPQVLNIAAPRVVAMEELARAAGHPFEFRPAPAGANQEITLNCRRLAIRHTFAAGASDPVQMVSQWKETLPK